MENQKIMELIKTLEEIEGRIKMARNELSKLIGEEIGPLIPKGEEQRANILHDIWNAGGVISQQELYKIARKHGMDNRGLGGFFVGKKPSLVKLANKKIALTEKAKENLVKWGLITEEKEE